MLWPNTTLWPNANIWHCYPKVLDFTLMSPSFLPLDFPGQVDKWHILRKPYCCCSVVKLCLTLWDPMNYTSPGFSVLHCLPEFAQAHVHWVDDAIPPSHPLAPFSLPALRFSQHQSLFQWVSSLHQEAKVLEVQLQYQSFQWYSGLISFRMDWLDLLAVQGSLKSLLHHNSKASILWGLVLLMIKLSHPYITIGKTTALSICIFVGKVMCMLFNFWCWRRLLRVPWTARRPNQSILKKINPEYSLEGLMLKLTFQYFGHLMWRAYSLEKTLMLGKTDGRRRRGWQGMRWLDGITDSMDMSWSKV